MSLPGEELAKQIGLPFVLEHEGSEFGLEGYQLTVEAGKLTVVDARYVGSELMPETGDFKRVLKRFELVERTDFK